MIHPLKLPAMPDERQSRIFVGIGKVVAKEQYRQFCRLTFLCPEIAGCAQPGQFVNLYLDALGKGQPYERSSLPPAAILPRPFTISGLVFLQKKHNQSKSQRSENMLPRAFSILFDLRGIGTQWLSELTSDTLLRIAGPLGKGFWLLKGTKLAVLVGGGIGVAPFPFLAECLKEAGIEVIALLGARTKENLPFDAVYTESPLLKDNKPLSLWSADEFEIMKVRSAIALDAPTEGFFTGNVVQLLDAWLATQSDRKGIVVYGCGPVVMMKALAEVTRQYNLPCQVSTEERMACGFGICFGCPILAKDDRYMLCCTDGPVFDASEIKL